MSFVAEGPREMPGRVAAGRRTFGARLCFAFARADRAHAGWLMSVDPPSIPAGSEPPTAPASWESTS